MTVEVWSGRGGRCSDSKLLAPEKRTGLTSAFTGRPIGFAALRPDRGRNAWRIVARNRSGTVAGFHGLPCLPRQCVNDEINSPFDVQRTARTLRTPHRNVNNKSTYLDVLI